MDLLNINLILSSLFRINWPWKTGRRTGSLAVQENENQTEEKVKTILPSYRGLMGEEPSRVTPGILQVNSRC